MLAVRLEAYAHQVKMRYVHEISQLREVRTGWQKTFKDAVVPLVKLGNEESLII